MSNPAKAEDQSQNSDAPLQEVIVTAEKRAEREQDVPVSVTALSADSLMDTNQVKIQDFYSRVPGVNVTTDELLGTSRVTIRGLTTGGLSNSTVGVVIDDVPYGSATNLGNGYVVPDIDPNDLAQVEILRGPQGTLYGADSMGGLLKYVTKDPSVDSFSGRVEAGTNSVYNGANLGYSFRVSANVPITSTLATSVSAFTRDDPGYIDDPILHQEGVNKVTVSGARFAGIWEPESDFTWKVSALYQDSKTDGTAISDPALGDLVQNTAFGSGGFHLQIAAFNSTLTAKFGGASLTAITAYTFDKDLEKFDLTDLFLPAAQTQIGYPTTNPFQTESISQELRLSDSVGEHLEWLLGIYYSHEHTPQVQNIYQTDFLTGAVEQIIDRLNYPSTYAEIAGFVNLTYKLTDQFDIQAGARESQNRQIYAQEGQRILHSEDDSATYLLTPRYKLTPDLMVYARFATGYEPGGPNINLGPGVPATYGPSSTQNYELGVKAENPSHTLSIATSIYYINWDKIQLLVLPPVMNATGFNTNGSLAKSEGLETTIDVRPFTGLDVSSWFSYNDAALKSGFPNDATLYGVPGNRLPNSSRFSGNLSLEETTSLSAMLTGSVGASYSYYSDSFGLFTATATRQRYPAYAKLDLHAGLNMSAWSLNLFANNVADKRAPTSGGTGSFFPDYFEYIPPRELGISISRKF